MRIKGGKKVRASAIFRRGGRLCASFLRVVFRVRLVLRWLGSEGRRVHVARPTRCMFRHARVFISGPLYGAVTREDRGSGEGVLVFLFGIATSIRAIVVAHAQRAGRRIRQRVLRLHRDLFLHECL